MATSNYTELDFDKVYSLVKKRGITLRELNTALGRNVSFMSNCKKRGMVPDVVLPLLLKILDCTLVVVGITKRICTKESEESE